MPEYNSYFDIPEVWFGQNEMFSKHPIFKHLCREFIILVEISQFNKRTGPIEETLRH
jgi:hypothetical protein